MKHVDELLAYIVNNNFKDTFEAILPKDKKLLISFNKQVINGSFLTEKQSNFLLKILRTYTKLLSADNALTANLLDHPTWSRNFRVIKIIRKVFLNDIKDRVIIEFSYDKDLKKKMQLFLKECHILPQGFLAPNNRLEIAFTEQNILLIVEHLVKEKFSIDQEIVHLHEKIIKSLSTKNEYTSIYSERNTRLLEHVNNEIVDHDNNYEIKLLDRRLRYQYEFSTMNLKDSLAFQLANRSSTDVWVNQETHSLENVVSSLLTLERLPLMLIFDSRDPLQGKQILENVSAFMHKYKNKTVGIYFRFDKNTEHGTQFNNIISKANYNTVLDTTTSIVGLGNGNMPKFMLKTPWKAKSVISFTNGFRNNKTAVYCNDIDLKIYYNTHCPLIGDINEVV